jgi:hypothetical protein
MNALSDPKGFATAQQQRNDQMKSMGIEETKTADQEAADKKKGAKVSTQYSKLNVFFSLGNQI